MDYAFIYLSSYDIPQLPFVSFLLYPWCVCVCMVAAKKEATKASVPSDKRTYYIGILHAVLYKGIVYCIINIMYNRIFVNSEHDQTLKIPKG